MYKYAQENSGYSTNSVLQKDEIKDDNSASIQNGRLSFNIILCNVKLTLCMLLIVTCLLIYRLFILI